jgi:hypothetical protein
MGTDSLLRALLVALSLSGCRCSAETEHTTDTTTQTAAPSDLGPLRRPARTYWVVNDGGQCAVHWEANGKRSQGKHVRCPRELLDSERMRLAGRTCLRESQQPERNVPVRCVLELFYAVRDDAARAGEWHLPAAP